MKFDVPLREGRLIRRYKRFLADVEFPDGSVATAHTPNTGSMKGCCSPGSRVWLKRHEAANRKYPFSWELVETDSGALVGINTGLTNRLVQEAIEQGIVDEFSHFPSIRREVRYGTENSRIDLLLEGPQGLCYVEIKNVTLVENGVALFPDAVSVRGSKHLRELARMVEQGHRAAIFYCVQRSDAREVRPAVDIDPTYARTLAEVLSQGVEALAYYAHVTPEAIQIEKKISVVCPLASSPKSD